MKKLKTKKVLDIQWDEPIMPKDVKDYFFNYFTPFSIGNGVWVEYEVGISSQHLKNHEYSILDKWLLENTNVNEFEIILLKHWW